MNVYGSISIIDKRNLWQGLKLWLGFQSGLPTNLVGDFNATLNNIEKQGALQQISRTQLDFEAFVDKNNLRDIEAINERFTWTNRRLGFTSIAKKMDKLILYGNSDH